MSTGFDGSIPPPPRPIEYEELDPRGWWLSMLFGAVLVVVGVWLLSNLYESITVLAILVGLSLIVSGVSEIVALGGRDALGWVAWAGGGVVIAAGLVILAWPDVTLKVIAVMAGLALLVTGAAGIALALRRRAAGNDWPIQLGLGAVALVIGALVLAWPSATLMVLGFILGVKAVITGLISIGAGWKAHQLAG